MCIVGEAFLMGFLYETSELHSGCWLLGVPLPDSQELSFNLLASTSEVVVI